MASTAEAVSNLMKELITQYQSEASSFLQALEQNLTATFDVDVPGASRSYFSSNASISDLTGQKPKRPTGLDYKTVTDPGATPTLDDLPVLNLSSDIPAFDIAAPAITLPAQPSLAIPSAPSAPSVDSVAIPVKPTLNLPTVPTLADVELPTSPGFQWPTFQASFPVEPSLLLRTDTFDWSETPYESELLETITAKLQGDLDHGGYGIETTDENALWARAKDRELRALAGNEDQIDKEIAGKGWQLPTGTLVALRQRALQDTHEKLNELHREIVVARADLFRKAREFAINKGMDLEQMLLTYHGAVQERAFNAAKMVAEFAVMVLNANISRYNIQLEAYKAYVSSYEIRVRSVLATIEAYKAEIEAAISKHEANKAQVELYNAQLNGANTLTQLYATEMQAARVATEIEGEKINRFRALVDAYVAQIGATEANVRLYDSVIKGELSKVEIFKSQVDAYNSQVNALKAKADVQVADLDARIKQQSLVLQAYNAQLEKYRADIAAETSRVRSLVDVYGADNQAYAALAHAWSEFHRVGMAELELIKTNAIEASKIDQRKAEVTIQKMVNEAQIRGDAGKAGVTVYQNLLAALGSMTSTLVYKEDT